MVSAKWPSAVFNTPMTLPGCWVTMVWLRLPAASCSMARATSAGSAPSVDLTKRMITIDSTMLSNSAMPVATSISVLN